MKALRLLISTAVLAIAPTALIHASDGTALWFSVNAPSFQLGEGVKSNTAAEVRFPEFNELQYYSVSQKFFTKLNDRWTLGTHPFFDNSKSASGWSYTYRMDLELNPSRIALGKNGPKLDLRNRWELRRREGRGSEIFHRLRHRTRLIWNLQNSYFSSIAIGNEAFYEADKEKFTANRFYPIALEAKHGNVKGSYYLMYQSKRIGNTSDWSGEYVLGIGLGF